MFGFGLGCLRAVRDLGDYGGVFPSGESGHPKSDPCQLSYGDFLKLGVPYWGSR